MKRASANARGAEARWNLIESIQQQACSPLPGGERSDRASDPGEGIVLYEKP